MPFQQIKNKTAKPLNYPVIAIGSFWWCRGWHLNRTLAPPHTPPPPPVKASTWLSAVSWLFRRIGEKKVSAHTYVCFLFFFFYILNENSSLTSCIRIFIYHWHIALRSHASSRTRNRACLLFSSDPADEASYTVISQAILRIMKERRIWLARWQSSVRFLIWNKSWYHLNRSIRFACSYVATKDVLHTQLCCFFFIKNNGKWKGAKVVIPNCSGLVVDLVFYSFI